jgi:hypothetical protein
MDDRSPARARVGVVRTGGEFALVATASIARGDEVLRIDGRVAQRPSQTSVQIDDGVHVDVPHGWPLERILDACPWRFMNHSCDGNVRLVGRRVVALRKIEAWEQIRFDYNTTEYDMSTPFHCRCESPDCDRAEVRGFAHLTPEQRARRAPLLAAHLQRHPARDRDANRASSGG